MRTATTKQLETMSFEKLSTISIIFGASREIYRRYSAEIWAVVAFTELAWIIWNRLGQ